METSPIYHTTSGISWNGADIHCENEDGTISLDICQGDRLTQAQTEVADAICNLIAITDAQTLTIPTCLITAWGTQNKTVLNFLTFLLNQHCAQQTQIDTINGITSGVEDANSKYLTLSTIFEVDYPDCCGDECIQGTSLKLVEHLEKILLCLCAQATELDALQTYVGNSASIVGSLTSEILALKATSVTQQATINSILLKTSCLDDC